MKHEEFKKEIESLGKAGLVPPVSRKVLGILLFVPFMVVWGLFLLFDKGETLCRKLAK